VAGLFGGIEAGGTKFVCAVGTASGKIDKKVVIPTTTPDETIPQVIEYFKNIHLKTPISAIGIASFGPVDPDPTSKHFGYITSTPKLAWTNYNILGAIQDAFGVPVGFDTNVNGAALGEYRWGEAQGLNTFIYMAVGTGIGAGGMVSSKMIHGLIHPEMGHMRIPHDHKRDPFAGICPFHGDCFEGLASGSAMIKRWKVDSILDLPSEHEAWELEADYLAAALVNCILVLSPQKIIIGGIVMKQPNLLEKIRPKVVALLNGYIKHAAILQHIEKYIVLPGLGLNAEICGAIALAEREFKDSLIS
jgi:fructokinase